MIMFSFASGLVYVCDGYLCGCSGCDVGLEMPWNRCGGQKRTLNIDPPHLPCLRHILLSFCQTSSWLPNDILLCASHLPVEPLQLQTLILLTIAFTWVLGIQTEFLTLSHKHCTHWPIAPAWWCSFNLHPLSLIHLMMISFCLMMLLLTWLICSIIWAQ